MRKKELLQRLLQAAEVMIQGGLSETTRRCGNKRCICYRDPSQRHGPHMYLTFRHDSSSQSLYVPPGHEEQARQAHAAWMEFREISAAISTLNRQRLQHQFESAKRPGQGARRSA